MRAERVDGHAARRGGRHRLGLGEAGRQPREHVQAGRHTLDLEPGERREQRVAAPPVGRAGAAQVAVELAALEEGRQRELLEHRRAEVGEALLLDHGRDEPRRHRRPTHPQGGRERLGHRVHVHDVVGRDALERPDRVAVVAVLGVVVVLDHQRAGVARPGGERGPPRRLEHDAGGGLVRRGDEHRVGARGDDRAHVDAAVVDGDRHRLDAAVGDQLTRPRVARILDRDAPGAAGAQHAPDHRHRLRHPAADHDPLRRGLDAADAAQVGGERRPQPRVAAGRRVAELGVGHLAQGAPLGRRPRRAREQRQVRRPGPQVVARRGRRRRGGPARRRPPPRAPRAEPRRGRSRGSPRPRAARTPPPPRRATRRARRPAPGSTAAGPRPPAARTARRRAAAPRPARAAAPPRAERRRAGRVKWSGS